MWLALPGTCHPGKSILLSPFKGQLRELHSVAFKDPGSVVPDRHHYPSRGTLVNSSTHTKPPNPHLGCIIFRTMIQTQSSQSATINARSRPCWPALHPSCYPLYRILYVIGDEGEMTLDEMVMNFCPTLLRTARCSRVFGSVIYI